MPITSLTSHPLLSKLVLVLPRYSAELAEHAISKWQRIFARVAAIRHDADPVSLTNRPCADEEDRPSVNIEKSLDMAYSGFAGHQHSVHFERVKRAPLGHENLANEQPAPLSQTHPQSVAVIQPLCVKVPESSAGRGRKSPR